MKRGSIFETDGIPRMSEALPLAMQHVVAMIVGCVTPAIIVSGAVPGGLSREDQVILIQSALVIAALSTLLQLFPIGGKAKFAIGSGLPIIMGVSFAYVPSMQAIAESYGIAAIMGAEIVGGVVAVVMGLLVKKIRVFFPPLITGTVVFTIGLSLYPTAINYMAGGTSSPNYGSWQNWAIAFFTLIVVTALNHFGKGIWKLASILIGIISTWVLGMICQAAAIYRIDAEAGFYSLFPTRHMTDFGKISTTFGQCFNADFKGVGVFNFIVVLCSFLFVDMFDTLGTLIGVASKADMLDKEGKLPNIKGALLSDAVGTTVGAMCGTSTVTTFVESASGVAEGGRTGLTSLVAAILFGLSLLLSPIFLAIPSFATAPALIIVGFLMLTSVTKIDFNDLTEAIPAFIAIIAMPFLYSISEGISMGVISYVIINVVTGKAKEKKISVLMYVLVILFILKYIFL